MSPSAWKEWIETHLGIMKYYIDWGLLPLGRSGLKRKHYLFVCINAKSIYHDWNADYYYGVVYTGQRNKASE